MFKVPEKYRIRTGAIGSDESYGNNGAFILPFRIKHIKRNLVVVASDGCGWEHISVHPQNNSRTPTWNEMTYCKNKFWDKDDAVIQIHPPQDEYVNCHPYTLHLWKPIGIDIHRPPKTLVGGLGL